MASDDDDCYYYCDDDGDGDGEADEEAADWNGLAVGADEDDLGLLEEEPPPPERRVDCWAITGDTLSAAQQEDLSIVMNLLNIKQHQARSLFIFHRWKIDCIYDCLDRKGRDRMLREAGIVLQEKNSMLIGASRTPSTSVQCNVCFDDDLSPAAVSTMDCGHCFCNDCWTEHFNAAIDGGKKQIRCMEVKCLAICDEGIVQRLLGQKYPDAAKRFNRFLLESYLEDNDFVKWCPSIPHCGRAIRVGTGDRYCEVKCLCGVSFCFNCTEQTHSPCPCTIWKKWNTRIHGESENIKWIVKNTKSCPKCFKPIEKRDGCNLVKCKCGQYLCWLCGGPTGRAHTWTNIEGHSCNRYKESKDKVDTGRWQLERYAHYCNRFKIHEDSYKEQHEKLGPAIKEKVKQLESNHLRPRLIRDGDWLTDAHQRLLWSRQVVSRSYAFAYHMFGGELRAHRSERLTGIRPQSITPACRGSISLSTVLKMAQPIKVVVTGAAGQIAYSLLYQIAKGDVFGDKQPIILHLLDIPPMMGVLEGVVMELADCALPLIHGVVPTADPAVAFKDVEAAFLVGAMPRKQGMERKDLLSANVKIFKVQGQALDQHAKKTVKVLVVGNPANTNALVCSRYAPSIPRENFSAMTRLDQNRAQANIAARLGVNIADVKNVIIWGNHSSTQYPDVKHATVTKGGVSKNVYEAVNDEAFLKGDFVSTIQTRGAAVIAARKMSSAMSAAKAAGDHMKSIWQGTDSGEWVSMGVVSDGSYGVPADIVYSFPVTIKDKKWTIVQGLPIDDFARSKMDLTGKELLEEREEALAVCQD